MQLHYSCLRNTNERMYAKLGADTGFDAISQSACGGNVAQLLSALDKTASAPRPFSTP